MWVFIGVNNIISNKTLLNIVKRNKLNMNRHTNVMDRIEK